MMGRGMEMEGCGRITQILMFVSNFIIWIGSIFILVLGIWAVVDKPYMETILGGSIYISAAYILIAVGVLTFIISFLGCFGAIKEIKCMLVMYFIIILILFVILLVGGILGFVYHGKAEREIKMEMTKSLREYNPNRDSPITKAWDDAQRAMKCCGIDQRSDWSQNPNFRSRERVPRSCCKLGENGEPLGCTSSPTNFNSFEKGCYSVTKEFVMDHAKYIGGAGIAVALLMVLGLVLSVILFCLIN
ncbi:UNVERIFIED_CONTAM: hypothetical protein RMT77_005333 [Armadillidium vulgare]